MHKKALVYCRVSSEKQVKEGHGLEGQEKRCRDYATNNRLEVVKVFKDEGISGGITDRPEMNNLLKFLDENKETEFVVLVDDLKRLARDVAGHFILRTAIYSRNATLESPSHRFEDTPEGKFIETILASASELERNQNARQVKNRMKARLENGYWPFRSPPSGLRYQSDPLHGKILRKEEPLASIYKEAIELYERRVLVTYEDAQQFILSKYKLHGLERPLSLQGAKEILSELLYTGYIQYEKWKIPLQKGKHDGFISLETHKRVLEIQKNRGKIQGQRKDFNPDFPLRPYILCSLCEKPITAAWCRGNGGSYPKYWCKTKDCQHKSKTIPKSKLEAEFEKLLKGVAVNKKVADLCENIFSKTWEDLKKKDELNYYENIIKRNSIKTKIRQLTERITQLKEANLIRVYEEQISEYASKLQEIDPINLQDGFNNGEFKTALNKVFAVLKEPVMMWKSNDYKKKTTILQMYFGKKLTYDLNSGFQTKYLEPPIKTIRLLGEPQKYFGGDGGS